MGFQYTSIQTHSSFSKGKGQTKTTKVSIRGKKGTKTVTLKFKTGNGKNKIKTKRSTKKLSLKEIKCIKECKFIPGLFNDCMKCIEN